VKQSSYQDRQRDEAARRHADLRPIRPQKDALMKKTKRVVYVGPVDVFRGLQGRLVEATDPKTRERGLHFQPESDGIMPVPCDMTHIRDVEADR
jgi:hypothetical protein